MNQSDHLPLFISIDIEVPTGTLDNPTVINPCSAVKAPRQLWDRADNTDRVKYRARLEHNLSLLHLPRDCINCTDYFCTDYSHVASIQLFHDYLIESCLEALKVIPVTKKSKIIPGRNEHVEQHKQTSQFWHFIWKDCGSPRNGVVAKIMRSTRSRYHYAIRYVKKMMKL